MFTNLSKPHLMQLAQIRNLLVYTAQRTATSPAPPMFTVSQHSVLQPAPPLPCLQCLSTAYCNQPHPLPCSQCLSTEYCNQPRPLPCSQCLAMRLHMCRLLHCTHPISKGVCMTAPTMFSLMRLLDCSGIE